MKYIFRTILAIFLLSIVFVASSQTREDELAVQSADWNVITYESGLLCQDVSINIFDSHQHISYLEFSTRQFKLSVVQPRKRTTVSKMAQQSGAIAAVNGGFFDTDTRFSYSYYYLKIDNNKFSYTLNTRSSSSFSIDSTGSELAFRSRREGYMEDLYWDNSYPTVVDLYDLLIYKSIPLPVADDGKRHPRTLLGTKPNGNIVMVVVDGRQKGMDGMTLRELKYLSEFLGMDNSINLDGGGSSTMWVEGAGVVNKPSDKVLFVRVPRKVANGLVVQRR